MEKDRRTVGGDWEDWAGACGRLTGQAQGSTKPHWLLGEPGIGDLGSKENKTNPN